MCQNWPRTTETEPSVQNFRFRFGDIAQLVEQMTFNHWVQGSSPCVPTRINRRMAVFSFTKQPPRYRAVGGYFHAAGIVS